jgi:hypothetical protein
MFIRSFFNIPVILGKRGNNSIVSTMNYILNKNWNKNNNNWNNQMQSFGKKNFIQRANEESQKKGTVGSFRKYCKRKLNVDKVSKKCIQLAKKSKNKKIRKKAVFAENIRGYSSFGMNNNKVRIEQLKTLIAQRDYLKKINENNEKIEKNNAKLLSKKK